MTIEDFNLNDFDKRLHKTTSERGRLGAQASGIEAASRVYSQAALNELNEKSIIEDADMARESIQLAKNQINTLKKSLLLFTIEGSFKVFDKIDSFQTVENSEQTV
jgi:hypothetical protein